MKLLKFIRSLSWKTPVLALICGAILHIAFTLAGPTITGPSVARRMLGLLPSNKLTVLAPVTPETQPWHDLGAGARVAVCPFDAEDRGVLARAVLPGSGWIFAVYDLEGNNIYSVAGSNERATQMSVLMMAPTDEDIDLSSAPRSSDKEAEVTLPVRRGIFILKAPDRGPAYARDAEAALKAASCALRPGRS